MWVLNFFSPFVSVRLCFIFSLLLFTSLILLKFIERNLTQFNFFNNKRLI